MCCEFEEMAVHLARQARRAGGENSALVRSLVAQIRRLPGGLAALVAQLEAAGLGVAAQSWVAPGENQPVRACAVAAALGEPLMARWVRRLDLERDEAAAVLAEILPMAVNRMTPAGRIEPAAPRTPWQVRWGRWLAFAGA